MVTVVLAVLEERREADLMLPWSLAAADGVNSVIAVVDEGGSTGNDEGPTIPVVAPRPSCSPIKTKKTIFKYGTYFIQMMFLHIIDYRLTIKNAILHNILKKRKKKQCKA